MSSGKEILQAIKDKNIDLLVRLLSNTDLNFYDPANNENTPLHEAVNSGSFEIVKMLIDTKQCEINALNGFNNTALHLAAMQPNIKIVEVLVDNGARLDIKNNRNKTPKDLAIETNNPEVVKVLLKYE